MAWGCGGWNMAVGWVYGGVGIWDIGLGVGM